MNQHPDPGTGKHGDQPVDAGAEPTRPLTDGGRSRQETTAETEPSDATHWAPTWDPEEQAEPRRLSVTHLVTGLVFLGIAGLWLAQETGAVAVDDLDLLVPLLLVVVGAAGLVAGLARAVRDRG